MRKFIFVLFIVISLVQCLPPPNNRGEQQQKGDDSKIRYESKTEKDSKYYLSADPTCAHDANNFCKNVKKDNNFAIFVCLQDVVMKDEVDIALDCHETLWHYKYNITKDPNFDEAAFRVCSDVIGGIKNCQDDELRKEPGFLTNCLIENRHEVTDLKCKSFLQKMSAIVFEDYRLIKGFYDKCAKDVLNLKCGTLEKPTDEEYHHQQAEVIGCLEDQLELVSEDCQDQLVKVATIQADDYHLDRPLFYACQEARDRFCRDIRSGEGRVYKCLLEHQHQEDMDEKCREKLVSREKLMQKDVKVNHLLWKTCKADFVKYKCPQDGKTDHGAASSLLLCLQGKQAEGLPVDQACLAEMRSFAIEIFDNYKISPIIVAKCDVEIKKYCQHIVGKTDDGDMMDCLMTQAATNDSLRPQCFKAISEVIKETGAGNNYKVDRALKLACEPVISTVCNNQDDAMVLGCLMDNVHNKAMPEACSAQVFHLQYFLSRDFRLDASLYRDCKKDAEDICSANDFNAESESRLPDNFVIACLYRNALDKEKKVSKTCSAHVFRVMKERAMNVKLMPEIESACVEDLGKYCLEKVEEKEEIDCLQQNYEQLTVKCRAAIKEFTLEESKDFDLDRHLVDKCASMVQKFCQRELEDGNGEKVLPCLVSHKNDIEMNHQCADAVEHWQLIELKDFEFSPILKDMCLEDIRRLCKDTTTKTAAIHCLSKHIVKDKKSVALKCRTQLKNELIEQSENLKLNPELYEACSDDIDRFCRNVPSSGGQLEECLRRNHKKLSNHKCKMLLFNEEKKESRDPELDYRLMHVCKPMITKYCGDYTQIPDVVECLRQVTHDRDMSRDCREIVTERQIEQAESFELDPELSQYCQHDVERYCRKELKEAQKGNDDGAVFGCLVNKMLDKEVMSHDCELFIHRRESEAAKELELNPQFLLQCRDEMNLLCPNMDEDEIIECMKTNMPKIKSKGCISEVKKLIVEGIEDVHVDPPLQEACARDIRTFCQNSPQHSGGVVLCLIDIHKATNIQLHPICDNFISKRLKLYNSAHIDYNTFDSITTVIDAVHMSPNRNYIYMTVLVVLSILFLGGILFGRFTKKVRAEVKNR